MTAVKGLAGYVLSRMSTSWETTSSIADRASVTTQQAGTCLARLTRLGLVAKGDVDASGLRLWQRVEVKPAIGVGDRVRYTGQYALDCHRGVVESVQGDGSGLASVAVRSDRPNALITGCFYVNLASLERLPDADPVPWDPPKPRPLAWAQQTRPEIPWHLKTPMQQRGVAP